MPKELLFFRYFRELADHRGVRIACLFRIKPARFAGRSSRAESGLAGWRRLVVSHRCSHHRGLITSVLSSVGVVVKLISILSSIFDKRF